MHVLSARASSSVTWLGWEGWAFVGTVAQLLALLTIAGAAWRFILQRRQVPPVYLLWSPVGVTAVDGQPWHILELRNLGRGIAHILQAELFGAYAHRAIEFRMPNVLGSGEAHQLLITTPELENCWIRVVTRTPADERLVDIYWSPLMLTGDLHKRWTEAIIADRRTPLVERWRNRRRPTTVRPDGMLRIRFRAKSSTATNLDPRLIAALGAVDQEAAVLVGTSMTNDLPYVGPG